MIKRGKQARHQKVLVYGVEGIGKSTFASQFPSPIFFDTEDRLAHLDVASIPINSIADFDYALKEDLSEFKTIILDTVDFFEKICINHVIKNNYMGDTDKYMSYGSGFRAMRTLFEKYINNLNNYCTQHGKHFVLIGHARMQKVEDVLLAKQFDRWTITLDDRNSEFVKAMVDCNFFCQYQHIAMEGKDKKTRAVATQNRILYTQHHAGFDAKNSWGLPESIEMDYKHIQKFVPEKVEAKTEKESIAKAKQREVLELAEPLGGIEYVKTLLDGKRFAELEDWEQDALIQRIKDDLQLSSMGV